MKNKRVVVGLSGGVDSSVAAYLLKEQGYDVIGIFMKNWHDESVTLHQVCPWIDDSHDAMMVAQHLGIPFQVVDLSIPYKEHIVDYMISEYQSGRTPNPDILCNREIKFSRFHNTATQLGADFIATGHYARKMEIVVEGKKQFQLLSGKDSNKDQSYFLCQLSQAQLATSLFPIGNLKKSDVRSLARKINLSIAEKKDSQGLCFIGKVHLPDFLKQKLLPKQGKIINIPRDALIFENRHSPHRHPSTEAFSYTPDMGQDIGEHSGAYYYTIGQRHGIKVGGFKEPLFVLGVNTTKNIIYTGMGKDHPGLYRYGLFVHTKDVHLVRQEYLLTNGAEKTFKARIRYRQPLEHCTISQLDNGLSVIFDRPQRAVAPGQFIAWYDGDELIGSGVI